MTEDTLENSILKNLSEEMRCGILTNPKGEVLIVHEQEVGCPIQWVEFDPSENTFSLIHEDGRIQDLGIELDDKIKNNLSHGQEVTLAHLVNKEIKSTQSVTFVVRDY